MNKSPSLLKPILPILLGFTIWLLALFNKIPYSVFELTHVEALLLAAPLWLISLAWNISKKQNWFIWLALSCGILFTIGFQLEKGIIVGLLILPWFLLVIILGGKRLLKFDFKKPKKEFSNLSRLTETAGIFYLPVGVFWAMISRFGVPFLGYDPTITLLTAVHFHYAGFILPQVTSWLIEREKSFGYKILSIGIIAGIPLVAIGISATHFQWPGWVEVLSVSIMTIAGGMVGLLYIRKSFSVENRVVKICFGIGGIALVIGMVLAFCYGWRHVFVIETLTIPWMYAVHGTCNAIGFAAPVLIGWKLLKSNQ